ncbi:MAG TPA: diacylglycerol kinase family protein [bacterium]|nr:diacylglycerol kinase family protein [bacterium]
MQYKFKRNHPVREINSFKYAFEGLIHAFFTEPNFRIQVFIVAFSIILSKLYKITRTEWSILIVSLGLLLIVELLNTVIEEIMDQLMKEYSEGTKIIKDVSAAAVLTASFVVLANLIIIFWPKIF